MRNVLALLALLGCNGDPAETCGPLDEVFVYLDNDLDGAGTEPVGWTCDPGPGLAPRGDDCDDADPTAHPGAPEDCDLVDDDCDGLVDEDSPQYAWFADGDGDGYGTGAGSALACQAPEPGWVRAAGDCDDALAAVNPGAIEVCNDGIDDDCDGFADDEDGGVDPTTAATWRPDEDGDGYGDLERGWIGCAAPANGWIDVGGDCDDTDDDVHPNRLESCNAIDDDCDARVDDADDNVDPTEQRDLWVDADLDGYGDADLPTRACAPGSGAADNAEDCDDGDPRATVPRDWVTDLDADGVGTGEPIAFECHPPSGDAAPAEAGVDCDESDPTRFPGAFEVCEDGVDQNCNAIDPICGTWIYGVNPNRDELRRMDVDSLRWETVVALDRPFVWGALAHDPATATTYWTNGLEAEEGMLLTLDLATGVATEIGPHGLEMLLGLAYDPVRGKLYATALNPNALYELDLATGAATWIGDTTIDVQSLAYDSLRDELIAVSATVDGLHRVDRATGATTPLFVDPQLHLAGPDVTYDPVNDLFWVLDFSEGLFSFDPNNGYAAKLEDPTLLPNDGLLYVPEPPPK